MKRKWHKDKSALLDWCHLTILTPDSFAEFSFWSEELLLVCKFLQVGVVCLTVSVVGCPFPRSLCSAYPRKLTVLPVWVLLFRPFIIRVILPTHKQNQEKSFFFDLPEMLLSSL